MYYWRTAKDSKLVKAHWHGPGMAVCNEVSGENDDRAVKIWVVHGSSLFRCTRAASTGVPRGRPPTSAGPTIDDDGTADLRADQDHPEGTRGPINYTDLAGDDSPDPPQEELGSEKAMDVEEQPAAAGPPGHRRPLQSRTAASGAAGVGGAAGAAADAATSCRARPRVQPEA